MSCMITNHSSPEQVRENLKRIRETVENKAVSCGRSMDEIQIMAVTKTVDPSLVNVAVEEGITLLGENRVQEYLEKREAYRTDLAKVHFIGTLQSNKVKYLADSVSMIESVSSYRLAQEINKWMGKVQKTMEILLEVNIGNEESKSGFRAEELLSQLEMLAQLPNIRVKGLMCIPPREDVEKFFYKTRKLFVDIRDKKLDNIDMNILSMGMSGDYELAIEYGSNIIRLGTALFGKRDYSIH